MFSNRYLLAGLLAAGLTGCSHEAAKGGPERSPAAPVSVQTAAAERVSWPSGYEALGTVRARTTSVISSRIMGYVREVRVQAGDPVRAGQTLLVLDSRDLEAQARQAEAAVNEARSAQPEVQNAIAGAKANLDLTQVTFRRMKDLFDKKSISNQEFDEASAKLKVAEAQHQMALAKREQLASKIRQAEEGLRSVEVMRGYAEIKAPFAGVVTEKKVDPGNLASPGAPLLVIEQAGAYRLEAQVEESRAASMRAGQTVKVALDAVGKTVDARVSEVIPAVDAATRAFTVKIDLPLMQGLRSGMFGRAQFVSGAREMLAIPAAAVVEQGQVRMVLVADSGVARNRMVTLGTRKADLVEVLSGLNPGDRVITPVPTGLSDGARVEAKP